MKKKSFAAIVWMAAGIAVSLCVWILLSGLPRDPVLLVDEQSVRACAEEFLTRVCSGDYTGASQLLFGTPDLGEPPRSDDPVGIIWDAYLDSIQYKCDQVCSCTDSQVTLEVQLQCLDIDSVTDVLQQKGQELLEARAREIHDESLVYDGDHNYLDSFLTPILLDATMQALDKNAQSMQRQLTLQFVRQDGAWRIVPTQQLQDFLSGFIWD